MTSAINLSTVPPSHRAAFASLTAATVVACPPSEVLVLAAGRAALTLIPRDSFAALAPFALSLTEEAARTMGERVAVDPGPSSRWVLAVAGDGGAHLDTVAIMSHSTGSEVAS